MAAQVDKGVARGLDEHAVSAALHAEGLRPHSWGNGPGERYGWHEHDYDKVLHCVAGSVVFHTGGGDLALDAGDRMILPAHTRHAATVGPHGCRCVEAAR